MGGGRHEGPKATDEGGNVGNHVSLQAFGETPIGSQRNEGPTITPIGTPNLRTIWSIQNLTVTFDSITFTEKIEALIRPKAVQIILTAYMDSVPVAFARNEFQLSGTGPAPPETSLTIPSKAFILEFFSALEYSRGSTLYVGWEMRFQPTPKPIEFDEAHCTIHNPILYVVYDQRFTRQQ